MKTKLFFCCLLLFGANHLYAQTGKYFNASSIRCGNYKVFIDYRIQEYCGSEFTIYWDGTCRNGYAEGQGVLTIKSKKTDKKITMTYTGNLTKGKKEGRGRQLLYAYDDQLNPENGLLWMDPYYRYDGSFKNDEFDGYGEFLASYPYPINPDDIGKGISFENLKLGSPIWRSDLFFYAYQGNFVAGKIGDTENAIGRTKRMRWVGDLTEYKGEVKKGMPNGRGTATEVTQRALLMGESWGSATGNFVDGRLEGYGVHITSWTEYEGVFVYGRREGKGKLTFYKSDTKSKEGRSMIEVMEANFKQGFAEGFCTIYFQNIAAYKYTGPVKKGNLEGTGEIEYLDGSKFRGNFQNGKMEGEGSITFANGDKFTGIYANDNPVRGTLYYYSGEKYEGAMSIQEEKDKITGKPIRVLIRQGRGTMTDKDGRTYSVNCEDDNCTESN